MDVIDAGPWAEGRRHIRLGLLVGAGVLGIGALIALRNPGTPPKAVFPPETVSAPSLSVYFDASTWEANAGGTGRLMVGGEIGNSGEMPVNVTEVTGIIPGGKLVAVTYHGQLLGTKNAVQIKPGESDTIWFELKISDCSSARAEPATLSVTGTVEQRQLTTYISPEVIGSREPWLRDALHCGR